MADHTLITGGAGFIGSHVAHALLKAGATVRVLDILHPQVHGAIERPEYLADDVELVVGDTRDSVAVERALKGIDSVIHLSARVGIAQSMYELVEYTSANALATAVLLEALLAQPVRKLIVASSMTVYGEGLYVDESGRQRDDVRRLPEQLQSRRWDPVGADGDVLTPLPTPETKKPMVASVYALDKLHQEQLCLLFGAAYGVPTIALRLFSVYGPNQALSNPYTGAPAIFAARLLNRRQPSIFEDGEQRRDFVSVHDVAQAFLLALSSDRGSGHVVNIGSGQGVTINEVAERLATILGREDIRAEITGTYRVGDIRHCFADISAASEVLAYQPRVEIDEGLREFAEWLEGRVAVDRFDSMVEELAVRGLTI